MRVNCRIAFAATVLEALDIENMDATASVVDKASLLEFARYQGHAAALHRRLVNQLFVTVRRQSGRRGPLQNGQIGLTRKGLTGSVSLDGLP